MKHKSDEVLRILVILFVVLPLMSGCGPSANQAAVSTSIPPTVTQSPPPTATPTETPVPYNLTVIVSDAEFGPLTGASVAAMEQEKVTGGNGEVAFNNLAGSDVALSVAAPGYLSTDLTHPIERGENRLEVVLERDPFGLLPQFACAPGEELLYLEDFQDGLAQHWPTIETGAIGWSVEVDPERDGNQLLASRQGAPRATLDMEKFNFQNAIWRLRIKAVGSTNVHLNWLEKHVPNGENRYLLAFSPGNASLNRFEINNGVQIADLGRPGGEEWHMMEIGFFQGQVDVYIDGRSAASWKDPNPWSEGSIDLEPYVDGDGVLLYDNFSVCGLSDLAQTLPPPETGYDLQVQLLDAEGQPVKDAQVNLAELGSRPEATLMTDDQGLVVWTNLPGQKVNLVAHASGYHPYQESLTIEKSQNEHVITLERDPYGLLATQACRPEEKLIYVDDFQDGLAQDWDVIEMQVPGWTVEGAPEQPENLVVAARENASWSWFGGREKYSFDQVVWRLRFNYVGKGSSHINFRFVEGAGFNARYIIGLSRGLAELRRFENGNDISIRRVGSPRGDEWHLMEIGFFGGVVMIYVDGKLGGQWTDPNPWEGGTINIEPYAQSGAVFYYDDFSICELSAPLESINTLEAP